MYYIKQYYFNYLALCDCYVPVTWQQRLWWLRTPFICTKQGGHRFFKWPLGLLQTSIYTFLAYIIAVTSLPPHYHLTTDEAITPHFIHSDMNLIQLRLLHICIDLQITREYFHCLLDLRYLVYGKPCNLRFNNISCTSKVITILFFHTFHPLYTIQDLPYTNMENVALVGQKHAE